MLTEAEKLPWVLFFPLFFLVHPMMVKAFTQKFDAALWASFFLARNDSAVRNSGPTLRANTESARAHIKSTIYFPSP